MSGDDFELRGALDDDDTARLIRHQREVARRYGDWEVAERQTAWLVENGYETAQPPDEPEEG